MSEKKIAIFLHIPKSGGSTLRSVLRKNYQLDEICFANREDMIATLADLSKEEWKKIKCINGHILFGTHEHLYNRPYNYYTMLRDPVEHVISEYYFIRRKPNNMSYETMQNMSFEEFITSDDFKGRTSNRQTFFISGGFKDDITLAKENLRNYFSIVGITEMFDESLFLMGQKLGWKDYYYKKKNVTKSRPRQDEFPEHVIELIKKNNEADIELYNYGKELLEARIQNLSSKSKRKMAKFLDEQKNRNE